MIIEAIQNIFGIYVPQTYADTKVLLIDGVETLITVNIIPDGIGSLNIEYVTAVILFGLMLYCTMRIIGGLLK